MIPLNLYAVQRTDKPSWDEFISFVCAARSPSEAKLLHPKGSESIWDAEDRVWVHKDPELRKNEEIYNEFNECWPVAPESLKVTQIGTASPRYESATVIHTDFKPG